MDIKKNPVSNQLWAWIKFRLNQEGYPTLSSLARKHNYSTSAFTLVKGYAFPNTEKIIANTIGMTPQALFPNRYTADGWPIGRNYPREIRLTERRRIRNRKDMQGNNHEKAD